MLSDAGVLFYCIAPSKRHYQCAEIALNCGADFNNATRQGTPILTFACETALSNEDLCLAILDAGADPTIVDEVVSATNCISSSSASSCDAKCVCSNYVLLDQTVTNGSVCDSKSNLLSSNCMVVLCDK